MLKLIVAEKNSVAKAIASYLAEGGVKVSRIGRVNVYFFRRGGQEYASMGLRGHLLDFDFEGQYNNWTSVDPGKLVGVEPVLVVRDSEVPYLRALVNMASRADEIILALDSDVEGEAIAYEVMLATKLRNPRLKYRRMLFSAVTKADIVNAFNRLTSINVNYVKKVFTRMVLDLKYGAVFTRLLTLSAKDSKALLRRGQFLSYGPCQTPVLNLVVMRALERENFKPEEFYRIRITVELNNVKLTMESEEKFKDKDEALKALKIVQSGKATISDVGTRRVVKNPPKPLETVELERRASRFLNIRSKRTLDVAEELYREGYISYPRTETDIYPPTLNLRAILMQFTEVNEYGGYAKKLLKGPIKPTSGRSSDNAHPPIHPVKAASRGEVLARFKAKEYWLIYDLVVRHFLATLSPPATIDEQYLVIKAGGLTFRAEGVKVVNQGYLEVYPFERPSEAELPIAGLRRGMEVRVIEAKVVKKRTRPPPYLSESELLRLMKKYGIGTDATMQDHIHTNVKRGYMRIVKGQCIPTPLGKAVIASLSKFAPSLIDPEFRAKMEKALSLIGQGKEEPANVRRALEEEALKIYNVLKSNRVELGLTLAKAIREMNSVKQSRT